MAAVGYGFAVAAFPLHLNSHIPFGILRTLVPMINVSMLAPVDPDWSVALGLWGPANAVLCGIIGLVVSEELMNRFDRRPN
jgi:hypothetical protein